MNRFLKITFFAVLALDTVTACKSKDSSTPRAAEIFPLKTGYKWIFKTVALDSTVITHVNEVIGDTSVYGESWHVLTYDTCTQTICKNNPEGWWFLTTLASCNLPAN